MNPETENVTEIPQSTDRSSTTPAGPAVDGGTRAQSTGAVANGKAPSHAKGITIRGLNAWYGGHQSIHDFDLAIERNQITALIGPSGSGKSTVVRCINRMHEEIPGARASGAVTLDDVDLYGPDVDVVAVRRAIGMVFQKPNPFPTFSIFDNVAAGIKLAGGKRDGSIRDRVERSLRGAALWEEVKDRLGQPGISLSGGQQQRLCIARAIAVEPDVILMDEPCSALDPGATLKIEELIHELKKRYTIVIVTHNMQQAARVADTTCFMLDGKLVEHATTEKIFSKPDDARTEEYVTGKFG